MVSKLRDNFGTPGLIAAAVLILVVLGVAYAAAQDDDGGSDESDRYWSAKDTLSPGATETGGWAFSTSEPGEILVPLSFPIQLPVEALQVEKVHFQPPNKKGKAKDEFEEVCGPLASGAVNPTADPGHLCVYYNPFGAAPVNATFSRITPLTRLEKIAPEEWATDSAGAALRFTFSGGAGDTAKGAGTFAVTAPMNGP
jgi:hypothetical protein